MEEVKAENAKKGVKLIFAVTGYFRSDSQFSARSEHSYRYYEGNSSISRKYDTALLKAASPVVPSTAAAHRFVRAKHQVPQE